MRRLDGKVCIVTGGARGIGRAACLRLAQEGARVAVLDEADFPARRLRDIIRAGGGCAEHRRLDVRDAAATAEVFDAIAALWGRVDVLVNHAGLSAPDAAESAEAWLASAAIALDGVMHCTPAAAAHMRARGGGRVVNLLPPEGAAGAADPPSFELARGALRELSRADARRLAADGVRVNWVDPGRVRAPDPALVAGVGVLGEVAEAGARPGPPPALCAAGRCAAEAVAAGVAYLASDAARGVTGAELAVVGGAAARRGARPIELGPAGARAGAAAAGRGPAAALPWGGSAP